MIYIYVEKSGGTNQLYFIVLRSSPGENLSASVPRLTDAFILVSWQSLARQANPYWCVLRREWMGMGVAGMIIDSYCGSFPHSLLSTSKNDILTREQVDMIVLLYVSRLRILNYSNRNQNKKNTSQGCSTFLVLSGSYTRNSMKQQQ